MTRNWNMRSLLHELPSCLLLMSQPILHLADPVGSLSSAESLSPNEFRVPCSPLTPEELRPTTPVSSSRTSTTVSCTSRWTTDPSILHTRLSRVHRPRRGPGCSVTSSLAQLNWVCSQLGRQLFLVNDMLGHHLVEEWMVGWHLT